MQQVINKEKLLALHYVYPITVNRLQKLLSPNNLLDDLEQLTPIEFAQIMNITLAKAERILHAYQQVCAVDFYTIYKEMAINAIIFVDEAYPKALLAIYDPPAVLYAKGDITLLQRNCIAVIGSRKATSYSVSALERILPSLIAQDFVIVSGLARGADTLAHKMTMRYGGQTIAVLGHGFYYMYPRENYELAEQMIGTQLIITEYAPPVKVARYHFPMRNRIISGMSEALVVTEAALKSGTLITTEFALEEGKDVFVVPGPIHAKLSEGTNYLLTEGASPVINGEQIVQALKMFLPKN